MKKTGKVDKREQHIKKKLTAAILMLLISSIMTVTSTYAWFTLSTAPEVTGIQTTIGGNGNLEIALANGETWLNPADVDTLTATSNDIKVTNASWGNLIDVSPVVTINGKVDNYGIEKLTLSPAALKKSGTQVETSSVLSVPKYGADGRVSELAAAMFGTYNLADSSFTMSSTDYGVRAIGISAAMTSRQSNYMNAKSSVNSSVNLTKQESSTGLQSNGGTLGNVAVKLAIGDTNTVEFTTEDITTIMSLLTDTRTAAENIDDAILSMMDAYAASAASQTAGITDAQYNAIKSFLGSIDIWDSTTNQVSSSLTVANGGTGYSSVTFKYTVENAEYTYSITDSNFLDIIYKYITVRTKLNTAITSLQQEIDTDDDGKYSWSQISTAVNSMMNIDYVEVAGMTVTELKQKKKDGSLIEALTPHISNLVVELGPNSGVYYDMAELVGTIKAGIVMNVVYGELPLNNLNATIISECENPLIPAAAKTFTYPTSTGSVEASRISDIYGFALDLLFRTNAENSNLLLQTTATDRIYGDNNNEETMGGGSTMTFTKSTASYSDEAMLGLMDAIKIVFIDETGTILGTAGLDTGSSTSYTKAGTGEVSTHALIPTTGAYALATYYNSGTTDSPVYSAATHVQVVDEDDAVTYRPVTSGEVGTYYTPDNGTTYLHATHASYVTVDSNDTQTTNYVAAQYVAGLTTNYVVNSDETYDVSIRMYNNDGTAFIYEDTKLPTTTYTYNKVDTGATHVKDGTNYYEVKYALKEGSNTEYEVVTTDATHYYDGKDYKPVAGADYNYVAVASTVYETVNPTITPLTQNSPKRVSVVVYLDGNIVGNDDVANAATSMTATMNLQFASDAGLVPMEYSGLHVQNTTGGDSTTGQ